MFLQELALPAVAVFVLSLCICAMLNGIFIPMLRRVKLGQRILEIGPSWHKCKEGTPTMGGVFFIAPLLLVVAVLAIFRQLDLRLLLVAGYALLNGLIGLVDDYVKLFKKRNEGLTAVQKLVLQFAATGAFLAVDAIAFSRGTAIDIPFIGSFDIGVWYYVITLIAAVYMVNCANLTDGIDGLAGSVGTVIAVMFSLIGISAGNFQASLLAIGTVGSLSGFLIYNLHPAKIFMGDTGSLFLGGLFTGLAFYFRIEICVLVFGIIWLIEGISVMLQVGFYKLTKKRIFKMAPIHHHFEMSGWSEVKIVTVASLVTAVFSAAVWYGFINR